MPRATTGRARTKPDNLSADKGYSNRRTRQYLRRRSIRLVNPEKTDQAVEPPTVGPRYRLSGGRWWSYYDQVWVASASGLDIDHLVSVAATFEPRFAQFMTSAARR